MDTMQLAAHERADLADLLETLTPEQWATPSLCAGWSVRDVAAHVVSWEDDRRGDLARRLWTARGRLGRLNDVAKEPLAEATSAELVALVRSHLEPRGATAGFGGAVGLTDAVIHHQDIRRPLGLVREIPQERLLRALDFARWAPPLRGAWHARGARLEAADLDWSFGRGPVARGPAEAALMTLAGRSGAARDLTGPGSEVLHDRLG